MSLVGGLLLATGCGSEVSDGESAGTGGGGDDVTSAEVSTGAGTTTSGTTAGPGSTSVQTSTGQGAGGEGGSAGDGGSNGEGGAEPGVGGAGGSGGEGGSPPETVCDRTALIDITSVGLDVEEWPPGAQRAVRVTLESPISQFDYPGVFVQSDNPYVSAQVPDNFLFGLNADEPSTLDVVFTAADFLEPGTPVRFDVRVVAMGEACDGTDTATLDVTLD